MKIKLGDVCTFQSGGTPTKETEEFFNGTIPWITTTALNGGKIDGTQAVNWITEKAIEKSAAKLVPAFSIMVGTRVGVGKVAVNTVQMSTSQDIISLINIDENQWDKDYLCKYIQGKNAFLNSQARGATIKGIKMDVLANLELEEITLENQARISETIDRVKAILDARKSELLELDKLVKARFIEMFYDKGYPILKWNDVFTTTTGKLDSNAAVEDGEYPFFTCSKEVLQIDKFAFDQEALLLAGNNAAGKYDVKYYNGKFNAYQRTYVLGLKEDWSYQLFRYQLEDKLVYLQQQSLGGLTKYLTMKILGELDFIIPPIEKQIEFEVYANQVDKSKAAVQESLDETQVLFDSLMQKYFG